ncbi:MAG: ABC transporter ATP-binding protein [Candidatus Bathyarchaeia archaeon]
MTLRGMETAAEYALEVQGLTKTYRVGRLEIPALRGVDLKVARGEFVSVVGPSGSGKSSLLNLLGTLDRPTSGKIIIGGTDTSTLSDEGLSRLRNEKIGFVFQAYNLINRTTVLRNVELPAIVKGFPREARTKRAMLLLKLVGIEDKAQNRPTELSGGQQQRVAIARALMNEPDIVLADEPTGNVDSKSGRDIFELLRQLAVERSNTIIVVTHNLELANFTQRIIYVRDGLVEKEVLPTGQAA